MKLPPDIPGLVAEVFDAFPAASFVVDRNLGILLANRAARASAGLPMEEVGGLLGCVQAADSGECGRGPACHECAVRSSVAQAFSAGAAERARATMLLRRGERETGADLLVSAAPVRHGGRTYALLVLEDVSSVTALEADLQRTVEALRASERQLSLVLAGSDDGFWDFYIAQRRYHFSPSCYRLIGEKPEAADDAGRFWWGRLHPDDVRRVKDAIDAHERGQTPRIDVDFRLRHAGGSWIWCRSMGKAVEFDAGGRPARLAGTLRDISARTREQERLRTALAENERLVAELTAALGNVKTLQALLPACAWCGKIKDETGKYQKLEAYISRHTATRFTHGICPECYARLEAPEEK